MKKIVTVLLAIFTMVGCSDEIRFNSPAMQAHKNGNVLWKAQFRAADIDNGGFVIEGRNSGEVVQLITTTDSRGTFDIGPGTGNIAFFVDVDGTIYSTENTPDPSVSLYPPTGQIIVDNVDNDDPKNVFGTFWFYAYTADGLNAVNFNEGVFYKVPLVGGLLQIQ
jgi:hypothetical protein